VIARGALTIAVALLAAGSAGASSGWHRVDIERSSGSIGASVSYDVRADPKFKAGLRFVDVTRRRPGLVATDASAQLKRYSRERGNVGVLAAWTSTYSGKSSAAIESFPPNARAVP
jgi:hypothetical protein